MTLLELPADSLARADELLDRASHDVAKYMAITARNIDPSTAGGREASLIWRDVLSTDGSESAWAIWRPLSTKLHELARDDRLAAIDRGMERLRSLAATKDDVAEVEMVIELVVDISNRIVGLRRDVRRRRIEVES